MVERGKSLYGKTSYEENLNPEPDAEPISLKQTTWDYCFSLDNKIEVTCSFGY